LSGEPQACATDPGTTKLHPLKEDLDADNVELTGDDLARIEQAIDTVAVQGERYPPLLAGRLGR